MSIARRSDLENWMKLLPYELRAIPLINLAIPGSHDSMSYGIHRNASVAPDAESIINSVYKVLPCVVRRWAKTQYLRATDQLMHGIRYFDLRICMKRADSDFYFVHGLFCENISGPLNEIKAFLDTHPSEVVILDCQHFYEFDDEHYAQLAGHLMATFGDRIYGRGDGRLDWLTLNRGRQLQKQLIVIFRVDARVPLQFWPSDWWPTPWPNQIRVPKLQAFLDESLQQRDAVIGYVTQCVLTPEVNYIVPRFFSSLRNTCANEVKKKLFDWIRTQRPGVFQRGEAPTCNVFIADFIDLNNYEFCRIVVELNWKLVTTVAESSDPLDVSIKLDDHQFTEVPLNDSTTKWDDHQLSEVSLFETIRRP